MRQPAWCDGTVLTEASVSFFYGEEAKCVITIEVSAAKAQTSGSYARSSCSFRKLADNTILYIRGIGTCCSPPALLELQVLSLWS
jgi:hypothetical protein